MSAPNHIRAAAIAAVPLVAGAWLCGAVAAAPSAAAAGRTATEPDDLLMSVDGENVATHLEGGLFDGLGPLGGALLGLVLFLVAGRRSTATP